MPWDWYEEQKQVADGLKIKMAGGEEEFGLHAYRWLIANDAFDILQPDVFYIGGMIRSMKVARMAQAKGKTIVPHLSKVDWDTFICYISPRLVPMLIGFTNSRCLKRKTQMEQ